MRLHPLSILLAAALACPAAQAARYTWHGDLMDGDAPAGGDYDLQVRAFANPDGGKALGEATELPRVQILEGRFSIEVDLPEDADGVTWVEVAVRKSDSGDAFERLGDLQPLAKVNGTCPGAWALDGNSGMPAGSYLGSADFFPVELRVNGGRVAQFSPGGAVNSYGSAPKVSMGSAANIASGTGATVAGGGATLTAFGVPDATLRNEALGVFSSVGGGIGSKAIEAWTTVGGGQSNTATLSYGVVAGGRSNHAGGLASVVGGGDHNDASGSWSTVAGGDANQALGSNSTVAGGVDNCAGGNASWAGGSRAKVRTAAGSTVEACMGAELTAGDADGDRGTFIWADSQGGDFVSSGNNQFLVRAGGGVLLNTSVFVAAPYDDLVIGTRASPADADVDMVLLSRSNRSARVYVSDSTGVLRFNANNAAGDTLFSLGGEADVGRYLVTGANAAHLTTGGTWTNGSSRAFKQAFEAIDAGDILTRVLQLPLSRWRYRNSDEGVHLGPMAEDFADAFGLGGSVQHISTVDADGVALAAIQGLNAKLEHENATLRATLDEVLARLARLEAGNGH